MKSIVTDQYRHGPNEADRAVDGTGSPLWAHDAVCLNNLLAWIRFHDH